jgi:uncharacterized protein YqgC (DUF456 family)
MMPGVVILVVLLMAAGLAGAVIPFLPGTPLILAGAALFAVFDPFERVGVPHLLVLLLLAALSYVLDHVAGAIGARTLGGSRWAVAGALVGGLAGLFFGPLGLVVGPVAGAVSLELYHRRELLVGLKSGLGTVLGMVMGAAAKLALAVVMVALFAFWVWNG